MEYNFTSIEENNSMKVSYSLRTAASGSRCRTSVHRVFFTSSPSMNIYKGICEIYPIKLSIGPRVYFPK